MTILRISVVLFWITAMVLLSSCSSPTPTTQNIGPPPPPPAPGPELEPAPPPPKPQPDPYVTAMSEVSTIVRRYGTVYANAKDDATADKTVEEIGRMTDRLRELTTEIGKMPYRVGQEKHALAFQME